MRWIASVVPNSKGLYIRRADWFYMRLRFTHPPRPRSYSGDDRGCSVTCQMLASSVSSRFGSRSEELSFLRQFAGRKLVFSLQLELRGAGSGFPTKAYERSCRRNGTGSPPWNSRHSAGVRRQRRPCASRHYQSARVWRDVRARGARDFLAPCWQRRSAVS